MKAPAAPAFPRKRLAIATGFAIYAIGVASIAHAEDAIAHTAVSADSKSSAASTLAEVVVSSDSDAQRPTEKTGEYTARKTKGATGLSLSARETPQVVSTITRAKLDDFKLNSVNDALSSVTGVTVERVETDRTYYTARGYDITNFQIDGIGMPFMNGNVNGDLDTSLYDRVEVLMGANGLMSGTGNPSATINFVRKRPTSSPQASLGLTYGSWNTKRLDADFSNALNEEKTLRGRVIASIQDADSYLDRYSTQRTVFSGILEGDINDATTLTGGVTYQRNAAKGGMWGALPMQYADGSSTNYSRSTNTAADWTKWDVETRSAFSELTHHFANDWVSTTTLTTTDTKERGKLFYVYGTPDKSTGLGLYSYPSRYDMNTNENIADTHVSGPFDFAGRKHEVIVGARYGRQRLWDESAYGEGIGTALPDLSSWSGNYTEPSFDASYAGSTFIDTQRTFYATTRLSLADPLKLIIGGSNTQASYKGDSYGESHDTKADKTTPYVGVIYDLTKDLSAYASYSGIFTPQYKLDSSMKRLDPVTGDNKEIGLKAESADKRLSGGFALFETHQDNLATSNGYVGATAVYKGVDSTSRGFELTAEGALTSSIKITAGYTGLTLKDKDNADVNTYVPRHTWNVATTWQATEALSLGAKVRWQGDTHYDGTYGRISQDAYALLDLMASYQITRNWSAALNLKNVTDKKYINSLYWEQAYYGAPINGSVSLNWKY